MNNKDYEFDLHVWVKPENECQPRRYTLSKNGRAICYDMPAEQALEALRTELEDEW